MSGLIFVARAEGGSFIHGRALPPGASAEPASGPTLPLPLPADLGPPREDDLRLSNPQLLPALASPLGSFLLEQRGPTDPRDPKDPQDQPLLASPCRVNRDLGDTLSLWVSPYQARVVDLRRVPLDSFLLSVSSGRAREEMIGLSGALGLSVLRYALAGIDFFADQSGAYGFCFERQLGPGDAPPPARLPRDAHLRGAWLLFARLWIEQQLGPRYYSALDRVYRTLGPSPQRALPRTAAASVDALVQELARDFRLPGDAIAALLQIPEWQRAGGLRRMQQVRAFEHLRRHA